MSFLYGRFAVKTRLFIRHLSSVIHLSSVSMHFPQSFLQKKLLAKRNHESSLRLQNDSAAASLCTRYRGGSSFILISMHSLQGRKLIYSNLSMHSLQGRKLIHFHLYALATGEEAHSFSSVMFASYVGGQSSDTYCVCKCSSSK
jgi:hypothetical protein